MLKFRKTVFSVTVLLVVLSMTLIGCTKETPTETASSSPDSALSNEPTYLPETNLIWYFIGSFPQPNQDAVFSKFSDLVKEKINSTVDMKAFSFGEYDQKMKVVIAAGTPWDICFTSNWSNNYVLNASKGAYLAVDNLMDEYGPVFNELLDPSFLPALKVNGKIYAVPNVQQFPRATCAVVPYDLALEANLDLSNLKSNDLKQLEPYLEMAYNEDSSKMAIIRMNDLGDSLFGQEWINAWNTPGAISVNDNSTVVFNQFESDNFKDFIGTLRQWSAKGWLHSQQNIAKTDYAADEQAGNVMLWLGSAYWPGSENPRPIGQYGGREYSYARIAEPVATTGGVLATLQAINRNTSHPERAMMLLNLVNSDQDVNDLINFGIKGIDYNIDNDDRVISVEGSYSPYQVWMWNSPLTSKSVPGMPSQSDMRTNILKYNMDAKKSPVLGFSFMPDNVKNEIAACNNIVSEYQQSIALGLITDAQYDEFLNKLKAAGSEKIIAEMQKQIDEWKAAN